MCLLAYNQQPKIAIDDIPIFKYLVYSGFPGEWYTPYTLTLVHQNKILKGILIGKFESPLSEEYYKERIIKNDKLITIRDGFIHAFTTAFAHHTRCKRYIELQSLIRGYIPKGTQYYISIDGSEICAKKIILTFD